MRLPQNIVSVKSDEDGVDHREHNIVDGGLKIVAHIPMISSTNSRAGFLIFRKQISSCMFKVCLDIN